MGHFHPLDASPCTCLHRSGFGGKCIFGSFLFVCLNRLDSVSNTYLFMFKLRVFFILLKKSTSNDNIQRHCK